MRTLRAPKALQLKLTRLRRYPRRQSRQVAAQMRAQGLDPRKPCPKGVRLGMSQRRARSRPPRSGRALRGLRQSYRLGMLLGHEVGRLCSTLWR